MCSKIIWKTILITMKTKHQVGSTNKKLRYNVRAAFSTSCPFSISLLPLAV